ncbi:hypothetical protein POPTR_018G079700v4 [Populus trichocarpa]|uniref:Uncharacterized protein n=1 Tax=Populus trichocarpa TaxID=3694 RepID=A9PBZ2_POPTR|nr:uncharacterized protein LOC7476278 [Populus trichocarpa]ABK93895.1 unknown [Populus trichocarpa]KAI5556862.1 hypothetical protein BDE02_18G063300 [Populus trichocarpa]PNS93273.1 hypothetical protein POPTR_018G079700v4 [Populus trichocarpa]|eukprot:XP_002324987.1 coiled-coil domain-containing protein 9 [Populus trichocarpa]
MASIYLSICSTSKPLAAPPKSAGRTTASASSSSSCFKSQFCGWFLAGRLVCSGSRKQKKQMQVVSMAPDEEKLTRRSPLDFPIEWERPKPGSRPDIFPQFSPMKTPIPPPLPYDPPEEDEEEEEEKKKEEEEEDPEKEEEPDKPEKQ